MQSEPPRGVVTFLMTDIEGSTGLWDLQPWAMEQALSSHQRVIRQTIDRHHGWLVKSQGEGDSTLSTFARASDAVAAAVALQLALCRNPEPGIPRLPTRMGLHTGEASLRDGDYYGGAPNRAARIRGLARGGQILCSQATHDLVIDTLDPSVTAVPLGTYELKGLRRQEQVFALMHPEFPRIELPTSSSTTTGLVSFVGRVSELGVLHRAITDVKNGTGRVVVVSGPPGIGKTTLVEQLAATHGSGSQVLWGRCHEQAGAPPFSPWLQILRADAAQRSMTKFASELGRDLDTVSELLPELVPNDRSAHQLSADRDAARFRLFEALGRWLERRVAEQPVMLVVDDLHWADPASSLLLAFLARECARQRVLIVACCRTNDLAGSPAVEDALATLVQAPRSAVIRLTGFGVDETAAYVRALGGDANRELVALLHGRTDGNPFFVSETLRHLLSEGTLDESTVRSQIPESVRIVISHRVRRLSEQAQFLLEVASVIGQDFDELVLAESSGLPNGTVVSILDLAMATGIVSPVHDVNQTRRQFVHALVRDVVYDRLTVGRRRDLHYDIGRVLARLSRPDDGEQLDRIAYHFAQAAPSFGADSAIKYCEAAAEHAMTSHAYQNAAASFEQAVTLLDGDDASTSLHRCDLVLRLGSALELAGERRAAVDAYRKALTLARRTGDVAQLTSAILGVSWASAFGEEEGEDPRRIWKLAEEAMARLPAGDNAARARLLVTLAIDERRVSIDERRALADEAVAISRRIGDPATLAVVLHGWVWGMTAPDALPARLEAGEEALALARELSDRRLECWIQQDLFMDLLEAARPAEIARCARVRSHSHGHHRRSSALGARPRYVRLPRNARRVRRC